MIIDLHAHCFPDQLAPRALSLLAERAGIEPYFNGTVSGLKAVIDEVGIDRVVLQPIATRRNNSGRTLGVSLDDPGHQLWDIYPEKQGGRTTQKLVGAGIKGGKFHRTTNFGR